jgi:uncharacterized protein YndB with AHSA1/START domain
MDLESPIVYREVVIECPPARVFEAWANPVEIAHWYVERAEGDVQLGRQITWTLGGVDQRLEVTVLDPGRHLVLTNVGSDDWKGTVLDVSFEPEGAPGSTRVALEQTTPSPALQDFLPAVDSGWACTLAVLGEYLLHHANARRIMVEAHTACAVEIAAVTDALASADAIADWAGERPDRVLVSAPRGAVVAFTGFPGVFTVMGVGGAHVSYSTWGDTRLEATKARVAELTNRLSARIETSVPLTTSG